MPVAGQRDPAQVKLVLEEWLGRQMPEASDVEITELVVPQSSGFSNETFLLDARWTEGGAKVESRLVLRSQPALHHLFPEIDIIAQQYTVMRQLGLHTDVPVPRTRWAESDPSVLGGQFFVMDRLEGLVPADGVYACWAEIDGTSYGAAVSIGNNPTFDGVPEHQVEAHLFDQDLDLYGATIELRFVRYVRPMRRFDGIDELVAALRVDDATIRTILDL